MRTTWNQVWGVEISSKGPSLREGDTRVILTDAPLRGARPNHSPTTLLPIEFANANAGFFHTSTHQLEIDQ